MTLRLSAVLIARDEAHCLGRCLSSLRGIADEVVVLDTGSIDQTAQIAEAHGARVFHARWTDDFAAARNEALSHAKGDWILWIDADEELIASGNEIRSLLTLGHSAFEVEIENLTDDLEDGERMVHSALRLFRRTPQTGWTGRIHEQVIGLAGPAVRIEGPFLRHEGYRPAVMAAKNKHARTIALLQAEVDAQPDDAFQRFNLANALLVAGQPDAAYPHVCRATELMPAKVSYGALAWFVRLQCAPDADTVLIDSDLAEQQGGGGLFVEFARAQAFLRLGEPMFALEASDRALLAPWPEGSAGDRTIAAYKARFVRAQSRFDLGDYSLCLDDVDRVLATAPTFASALHLRAECLRRLGLSATDAFEAAWRTAPADLGIWTAWIQACEAEGDVEKSITAFEAFAYHNRPNGALLINWGRALERLGDESAALEKFQQAVEMEDQDPNALLNLADAFARRRRWTDAAGWYERALRLNPQNAAAWFALGNAFAHSGLGPSAMRAYDLCLRYDPTHEAATYNRAIVTKEMATSIS